jgi:hypothetical protein
VEGPARKLRESAVTVAVELAVCPVVDLLRGLKEKFGLVSVITPPILSIIRITSSILLSYIREIRKSTTPAIMKMIKRIKSTVDDKCENRPCPIQLAKLEIRIPQAMAKIIAKKLT